MAVRLACIHMLWWRVPEPAYFTLVPQGLIQYYPDLVAVENCVCVGTAVPQRIVPTCVYNVFFFDVRLQNVYLAFANQLKC